MDLSIVGVAIFAYNRPVHFRNMLKSFVDCYGSSHVHVDFYIDGPKTNSDIDAVEKCYQVAAEFSKKFASTTITKSENNNGLAASVVNGMTKTFKNYDIAIALEDDLLFHKEFLTFTVKSLLFYQENPNVYSVTGFAEVVPDTVLESKYCNFSTYRHSTWGWGTYKEVWSKVDWTGSEFRQFISNNDKRQLNSFKIIGSDIQRMMHQWKRKKIDSWSVVFDYHAWLNGGVCVCPVVNLVTNTGFDGMGTNCRKHSSEISQLSSETSHLSKPLLSDVCVSPDVISQTSELHSIGILKKIWRLLK